MRIIFRHIIIRTVLISTTLVMINAEEVSPRKRASSIKKTIQEKTFQRIQPNVQLDPENLPINEHLEYMLKWTTIPAGNGKITIQKDADTCGRETIHIISQVKSNKFVDMFYKVRDKVETFLDPKHFTSAKYIKQLREGKYKRDETIEFDYEQKKVFYHKHVHNRKEENKIIPITSDMFDPMAALYYLRHLTLEVGTEFTMPVHTGGKTWVAHVRILEEKIMKIRFHGAYNALLIEVIGSFEGIFVHKGKSLQFWADKQTKIPLSARIKLPFGSIHIDLIKAKGTQLKPIEIKVISRETRKVWAAKRYGIRR